MPTETTNVRDRLGASVGRKSDRKEGVRVGGVYVAKCLDADGNLKWDEKIENLVTTVGKNDLLDKYLEGSGYTAAWYGGLIDNAGYSAVAVGDTMGAHGGWAESTDYDEGNRPSASFAAAASGEKATDTDMVFSINASKTIKGAFLVSDNNKGGANGILYSAGLFTGGDKIVDADDTLNISYTANT